MKKSTKKKNNFSAPSNVVYFNKLQKENHKMDYFVLVFTLALVCMGLIMLYSASSPVGYYRFGDSQHYIKDQFVYASIGVVLMLLISKIDYHFYIRFIPLLTFTTYALLTIVLFMPALKGCKRWIIIPGVASFQPSEIAKFFVIMYFAFLVNIHANKMNTFKYGFAPFIIILVSIAGLMVLEPHLSGTIIILAVGFILMFVGGTPFKWFLSIAGILIIGLVGLLLIKPDLVPYAATRINIWRHPEMDLQGAGYQSYQSLLAIGSGGLTGKGIGNSNQKHLFLPEPQNDFIYSVICEELGFIGGMFVLILFIGQFLNIVYVALKAKDKFGCLLCIGIGSQIFLQALLNIGVATNTLPNTGISLPFFSEGGTSLIMLLAEMGIVLSVSRQKARKNTS